jgi:hypothetical protein
VLASIAPPKADSDAAAEQMSIRAVCEPGLDYNALPPTLTAFCGISSPTRLPWERYILCNNARAEFAAFRQRRTMNSNI